MEQDIRKFFKDEKITDSHSMPIGHVRRFEKKLEKEFPQKQNLKFMWSKIAAVLVIALITAMFFLIQKPAEEIHIVDTPVEKSDGIEKTTKQLSLSDISPEYKKVEDYYLAGINVEISKLDITEENKDLIDSFMEQLSILDKEYAKLNSELTEAGINEQTIEALVDNLKLRLELLIKLKTKLKELKKPTHENYKKNNI